MAGYLPLGDLLSALASTPPGATLTTLTVTAPSHFGGLLPFAVGLHADPLAALSGFSRLESLTLSFADGRLPGGFGLGGVVAMDKARLRALLGAPRPVRGRAPALRLIEVLLTARQVVQPRCSEHKVQLPAPVSWACCVELMAAHPGLRFDVDPE